MNKGRHIGAHAVEADADVARVVGQDLIDPVTAAFVGGRRREVKVDRLVGKGVVKGADGRQDEIAHLACGHRKIAGVTLDVTPVSADLGFVVVPAGNDDAGDARIVVPLPPGVKDKGAIGGDQIGVVESRDILGVGGDARWGDGDHIIRGQVLDRLRNVVVAETLASAVDGSLCPQNRQGEPDRTGNAAAVRQGELLCGNLTDLGLDTGPIEGGARSGNTVPVDVDVRGEGGEARGRRCGRAEVIPPHQDVVARPPHRFGNHRCGGRGGRRGQLTPAGRRGGRSTGPWDDRNLRPQQ